MPPKNGQAKKKRIPHANETPLKDKQPGHGAVERAKNQMWSSEQSSAAQQTSTRSYAPALPAVDRPKYKATSTIGVGVGIGRGGGGIKKKNAAVAVTTKTTTRTGSDDCSSVGTAGRSNPDSDFFGRFLNN